eukprot:1787073-Rhodomonas_salina.1
MFKPGVIVTGTVGGGLRLGRSGGEGFRLRVEGGRNCGGVGRKLVGVRDEVPFRSVAAWKEDMKG